MSENDLRNEILQSTQRLMSQIDQIKPVEINPEEIEKSQAFINRIETEQIQNIEKSHSLLRDVSDWGDKRKDQYDEFEKPLLKTVEKSVHASEEVAKSAIPLLQEKINNYDRRIGDLKSSIASMGDAIAKTAKETYDMIKNGNEHNSKPEEPAPFLQFSISNSNESINDENDEKANSQQQNSDDPIDDDTSFDMIQSLKLREEHLLNVVKALSNEMKSLKSSIKTEQSLSKNFHYELEYIKNHAYSPTLIIDSDNSIEYEQFKNNKLMICANNSDNDGYSYEIPLVVIEYKNQNESTKELEEAAEEEKRRNEAGKNVIIYQNFDVCDIDPNENYDFLKEHIMNEVKSEYYVNLKDQSIQIENNDPIFLNDENSQKEVDNNRIENSIESFEIVDILSTVANNDDQIGKVTIKKEKGNDHHIFNYSENMNSEQAADDLDELINFHRLFKNEDDNEYDEDSKNQSSTNENNDDNDMKLQKLKVITDFKHAAKIVYNTKTGKREIITENNKRIELEPTDDDSHSYNFTSSNDQHLNVVLLEKNENQQENDDDINIVINQDEVVENRSIYITNERNEKGEEIKLQVIINKDGESYVTNNDSENKSRLFFDSKGSTFIYDNSNSVQIPVVMNETGQIMYEMSNSEFIQVAMMNLQSDLFYINEKGEKMQMQIDENGNFYVLSNNGQRIHINIFKNSEVEEENINETQTNDNNETEVYQNSNNNNNNNNQYQDRLVPVSISRKDNELKIIYKDNEDAVVVNTSISHTTQDGQIILRPNTTTDSKSKLNSGENLAVKGVKFDFNDNPGTRVTRIVGGFNKSFMRRSRRKKFNWTVRPSYQVVKLNIKPKPPRCYYHQPVRERHLANANNLNEPQTNPSKEVNKNTALRWIAFPVRPPPLYCRKTGHLDLSITGISAMAEGASNQSKDIQSNENSETAKYVFNKRKIVQPDSKINKVKLIQEKSQLKSEQYQRKVYNNFAVPRNQKFTASPSPRRQLQHQQLKRLNPITPNAQPQLSVQPATRIKFNAEADFTENQNDVNPNLNNFNVATIELPQF